MKRVIFENLIKWKDKPDSLPILIYGSRQVGKTYIIQKFAKEFYKDKYVYINFFEEKELKEALYGETSPKVIIDIIETKLKVHLADDFLIIFDEVQEVPTLKTALKLFVDLKFKQKVICTGSYLANTLNLIDASFPVGKVEMWNMYPMSFKEFLMAIGKEEYIDLVQEAVNNLKPIDNSVHKNLIRILREFFYTGGMPEVVQTYIDKGSAYEINKVKEKIYYGYRQDITKYMEGVVAKKQCLSIFDEMPTFHARRHNRFVLSELDDNARYLNFESSIKNILLSKIVYKVDNLEKLSIPLFLHEKHSSFKLYYNDWGFLPMLYKFTPRELEDENNARPNQRGSIAENFVFSEFYKVNDDSKLNFYTFQEKDISDNQSNSNTVYEVDMILENDTDGIVPIEIKYGKDYRIASLTRVMKHKRVQYGITFSTNNISYDKETRIINLPLYCAGFLDLTFNRIKLLHPNDKN